MTVSQTVEEAKPRPASDQLQLATLILTGTAPPLVLEDCGKWSEQDYRAFNRATWRHIEQRLQEEENAQSA